MFRDRIEVGQKLAIALKGYRDRSNTIVVALPRGGVVPAEIVAQELNLPMEVVMVKKIGHPSNSEFAIGAASLTDYVIDDMAGVDDSYLHSEIQKIRSLLKERYNKYYGNRNAPDFINKTVLIIDDGVATGRTVIAAIKLLRQEGANRIVVAVPVGPSDTLLELRELADDVVCLEVHDPFFAIGEYYEDFGQVSDQQVVEIINRNRRSN